MDGFIATNGCWFANAGEDKGQTEIVRQKSRWFPKILQLRMKESDTKTRILMAAGPIFARKGFRSATVREICDAAEVNVASINYYFGDKQKLYNETVITARQMRAQQVPNPTWDEATAPEEKLHDFIEMCLARLVALESEPWQVRLLMREILKPTEASKTLIKDYFRPFFEMLLSIVDDIVEVQLPHEIRTQIGFSIIGQCLYYRFTSEITGMMLEDDGLDQFTRPQLAEHIAQFSLRALDSIKVEHLEESCLKQRKEIHSN